MKKLTKNLLYASVAGITILSSTIPYNVYAMTQDETVYAKLQANGDQKYVSVTKHLINDEKTEELTDLSSLSKIENLNGFEGWSVNGPELTWGAAGKDIYYRGESDQELPVTMKVVYKLNGEVKELDEMLGKSGQVEIQLEYINHAKNGNLWTPFVVAVATTLDETKVSNINVTNGKVTSNGRNIAIAAVAAPGLYESLGLKELKDTDKVVISFETTNFELGDIYSVVTPKLLDSADLKIFDELEGLYADTERMSQGSQDLVTGARALRAGILELRTAVASARNQVQGVGGLLDEATIDGIKIQASTAAHESVKTQAPTINAMLEQQLANNEVLLDALKLEAEQMCKAQYATCSAEMTAKFQEQLLAKVKTTLAQSSMELATQVAMTTAAATAESVATQLAGVVGEKTGALLLAPFDAIVGGIDQVLNGADELCVGIEKFDKEGVQTLNSFVNGQLRGTADKAKRLTQLADQYDNFSGKADGVKSETKFVLMIEGRKAK